MPSTGCSVVNGYSATFGFAFEMRAIKRRLSGIRQAHERGVGEQLQMQLDVALVARRPDLGETRHLPGRRDEARVAPPAVTALRQHDARAGVRQIGDQVALVREHLCADRDAQLHVGAVGAMLARAAAVPTPLGLDPLAPLQRREVAQRRVGEQHDVAAVAAVAAVRAALRDELLAPEATGRRRRPFRPARATWRGR